MAAGFLGVGNTLKSGQNNYDAKKCMPGFDLLQGREFHRRQLEQYRESYLRLDPATFPSDLANTSRILEFLIERKLKMFPDDTRQIVSARAVIVGTKYRIEVASATLH